ncbi:MAG: pilus assembly protein Flp/PilA [Micromonosporaceae bacterium]|jgi:pilus assembly protein Flp/PilA|nr:pilus assembly protein Flp/PilA [Micromonosporaceae bacterium]MDT5035768.1 pilus assembly protein Flp/PilA [Micromonosporaceae bacterium]
MNHTAMKLIVRLQAIWATRAQGATAVEYALMVSLIAIAIIAAVTFLGGQIGDLFNKTGAAVK